MPTAYRGSAVAPVIRSSVAPAATIATPSTTQVGDLVLAFLYEVGGGSGFSIDPGSGWEFLVNTYQDLSFPDRPIYVLYRVATIAGVQAVEPVFEAYAHVGLLVIEKETFDPTLLVPLTIEGADSNRFTVFAGATNATATAPNPPAISTPTENCLVCTVGLWELAAPATGAITPPTGYTEQWEMAGSVSVEFSLATLAVVAAASTNPDPFADNITPSGTTALTFAIRPYGRRDTRDIPITGDARTATLCEPPWKFQTEDERSVYERIPEIYQYQAQGAPTLFSPTYAAPYLSSAASAKLDIPNCVPGDEIVIDLAAVLHLNGSATEWPTSVAAEWWLIKIQVTEDFGGTPVVVELPLAHFGPSNNTPYLLQTAYPIRIPGYRLIEKKGTFRIEMWFRIENNGSSTNALTVRALSILAHRFPSAFVPVVPTLASSNFDLADPLGGDTIILYGTNLYLITSCSVGGTAATVVSSNGTSCTITMPAKAAGTHAVTVTNSYGTSGSINIETWSPATEGSTTAFAEAPGYTADGDEGSWTMRVGTAWTAVDPNVPNVSGGFPNSGALVMTGTLRYLTGPALNALFDLTGVQAGTFGLCIGTGERSYTAATEADFPSYLSDNGGATNLFLSENQEGVGITLGVQTDQGYKKIAIPPVNEEAINALFVRFASGTTLNGALAFQIDGHKADGSAGFETATTFNTLTAAAQAALLGINSEKDAAPDGGVVYAFFFATTSFSDALALKWRKWCRVRHDAAA